MRVSGAFGEFCWYAIQTKPKQEHRAEQNLRAFNFETFAPNTRERSPLKMGMETGYRVAPLFPGYIFARFVVDQHLWRIRMTSGVHDLVSFGSGPALVDDDVITLLRARVAEMTTRGPRPPFVPGDYVMVQDGPLRNLVGIFEREMNGGERVAVLLSAIHLRARTVIDLRYLAKVEVR
jgi:transcriptional antiterminator RfaH